MQCSVCPAPATKKVIWADGRAFQPACSNHVKAVQTMLTKKNGKMTELAGVQDLSEAASQIIDLVSSRVYPGLERKPGGPDNWVEAAGGLPSYIERIAKHLHYERGFSISRAIASAVNTVKRWAVGGLVAEHGTTKRVSAKTQALAAKALAEWEAKKRAGDLRMSDVLVGIIDLTEVTDEFAAGLLDLADADIDDSDTMVALMLPKDVASKVAVSGGVPADDLHVTITFNGSTTPEQYAKLVDDLQAYAKDMPNPQALKGTIGGIGSFPADDAEKGNPWWVPVDIPGLNTLHEQVRAVSDRSAEAASNHGYTPHMTLTYVKDGGTPPAPVPSTPVQFDSLWVVRGGKQRTEIPLHTQTGADLSESAILSSSEGSNLRGAVNVRVLAERAGAIEDPVRRAAARQRVLDLAVTDAKSRKRLAKQGKALPHGGFPIPDIEHLKKAIRAIGRAKDPEATRRFIIRRARELNATNLIPDSWDLSETVDLSSTIPPRNKESRKKRAKDGRPSYDNQGQWKHGFIPVDRAAREAKAKGSPIAMNRMRRLFGTKGNDKGGRAGARSANGRKSNPKGQVSVDEKKSPVAERANDVAFFRHQGKANQNVKPTKANRLPESQKEASKSTRIPNRARQNWDEIPEALKTVRNGKRYVLAQFGGKGYLTEWLGGVHSVSQTAADKRKVMRTLSSVDAANMSPSELRGLLNNPRTPDSVKRTVRKALKAHAKEASR